MLTKIAEKLGLLDVIAPRRNVEAVGSGSRSDNSNTISQESTDEIYARKLQAEEDRRYNLLKAQREAEEKAEKYSKHSFVKRQRVLYHHRTENEYYPAVVAGVHLDDGPENPYYTITYTKVERHLEDHGNEEVKEIKVEKQTNHDRLTRVPWDEDRTWEIIAN